MDSTYLQGNSEEGFRLARSEPFGLAQDSPVEGHERNPLVQSFAGRHRASGLRVTANIERKRIVNRHMKQPTSFFCRLDHTNSRNLDHSYCYTEIKLPTERRLI
ncbi:protein of unknown function [Methylocaldum szegediense]|uniref:Transposase DDE domain-containing protein n=1 Tax=Methylocaldum szegediense TaxID=73780 RepID=A0ABM9I1L2_9GAMM|nr:protein of unknown function [Methylocaldum szegediense]